MNELQRYKEALERGPIATIALRPPIPVATLQALRGYNLRFSGSVNITFFSDASGTGS